MFGEIGAWLYKGLGGMKPDQLNPGFKNVLIHPFFPDQLKSFEATHTGPYGEIRTSWKRNGKKINYTVIVPANSSATLYIPEVKGLRMYQGKKATSSKEMMLTAGTYEFQWK
jgi:alpha-L-rhamnosidase